MKLKKSLFIFFISFSFYFLLSTIFPYKSVVGALGEFLGGLNFLIFGFLSIFIPIFLGYLAYLWFKDKFDSFYSIKLIGGVFLFLDLLFFQSFFFNKGLIGNLFVNSLDDYIGVVGTFLFLIVFLIWSLFILFEEFSFDVKIPFLYKEPPLLFDIEDNKDLLEEKEIKSESILSKIIEDERKKENDVFSSSEKEDKLDNKEKASYKEVKESETEKNNLADEITDLFTKKDKDENREKESFDVKEDKKDDSTKDNLADGIIELFTKKDKDENREKESFDVKEDKKDDSTKDNLADELTELFIKKEPGKNEKEDTLNKDDKNENIEDILLNEDALFEIKDKEKSSNKEEISIKSKEVKELEETKELLSQIEVGDVKKPSNWKLPSLDFLSKPEEIKKEINEAEIDDKIHRLIDKLKNFKIEGDVVRYYVGPIVTTFEFKPLSNIKLSKISALQDDIAMALRAESIRILAPIPGKDVVGIEIPNTKRETIYLREILESNLFQHSKSPLTVALGKDIVGKPIITDLAKLPHLLIGGTTGSGKSVAVNSMIVSLLYRNSPEDLKLLMVDPKILEFSVYNDIPHLLTPVITDPKKAILALKQLADEMDRRYHLMSKLKVKNIATLNEKYPEEKLPYIVVVIDELAELMMTGGKDAELFISRIAQKARAAGIHLIIATQRPSVDVVTGLIKANLPSRIALRVGQKIDSKVIIDQFGAESLLGMGDMLFTPPGQASLMRLHAPYVSEEEIEEIVEFLKSQGEPDYDNGIVNLEEESSLEELEDVDELFEEAKEIILRDRKTSTSYLQRRLSIGYNRAANIIEQLERAGFLTPPNAKGQREINV